MVVKCKCCNKEFTKIHSKNQVFCSKECKIKHQKDNSAKIIKVCPVCEEPFETYPSANHKFCSVKCSAKGKKKKVKGLKRKPNTLEQNEAIKKRTENYYKITPLETLQKRWTNISIANKVHLTSEEVLKLEEVLTLGYIRDKVLLMKAAQITNKSYKALNNYISENPEWIKQFKKMPGGGLDWKIQSLLPAQFKEMLKDLKEQTIIFVKNKWGIGEKPQVRLRKFYNITNKYNIDKKESRPESIIRGILESLNIKFKREVYLCRRFRGDFLVGRKVIEIHGDYWHGNPLIYTKDSDLNDTQWTVKMNDTFKREWLINNDYEVLCIWEKELNEINFVKQKIKDYLCIS